MIVYGQVNGRRHAARQTAVERTVRGDVKVCYRCKKAKPRGQFGTRGGRESATCRECCAYIVARRKSMGKRKGAEDGE